MMFETSLIEQKSQTQTQNLCGLQTGKSSSKARKNRKRQKKQQMPSVVQKLYQTCKEVFAEGGVGFVPPPQDIERLKSVLDSMKPEDVGLTRDMPYFKLIRKEGCFVTYLQVYECPKFSIGIFCLPQSAAIPLHNHPGMTVFSKLLLGAMHIKSYDWVSDAPHDTQENLNEPPVPGAQLAKVKADVDFTAPCDTSILYPADGGNMHCFTALTPCAVIDVLGPPYSDPEGRHCTYYREFPCTNVSGDVAAPGLESAGEYAWLQEREKPKNFFMVGATYDGPKVVEI